MSLPDLPSQSPERVAALRIPHAALRLTLAQTAESPSSAQLQILCDATATPPRVLDASEPAIRLGVRPGMVLRDALARCPSAAFHTAVPADLATAQERWLHALEEVSPSVEADGDTLGAALISAVGLTQLYGDELGLIEALRGVTRRTLGLEPLIAIADGPFTARIATTLARTAAPAIAVPGQSRSFIARASIDWLPLDSAAQRRLQDRFAIHTIGEFAALPFGAVQAQFGPVGAAAWKLAHGQDTRRLRPRQAVEQINERLAFPSPVANSAALHIGAKHLLTRALQQPALHQRAVRQIGVWAQVERGPRRERISTLREPSAEFSRLWIVTQTQLDRLWQPEHHRLPGPVEAIGVDLAGLCAEEGKQGKLWAGAARQRRPIEAAARQLQARFGAPVLYRIAEIEPWSRFPERQTALIAYEA